VFFDKKVKTQPQQNKKSNIKTLVGAGIELGTSCTQSRCVTTAPPSQQRVLIVVQPFNCFDAMRRNVNKAKFAGQTFLTNTFFLYYFYVHE